MLDDRYAGAVRVGVASHNLFDIAWALSLGHRDRIDLEMLEGMAPAQSRVVRDEVGEVLLYAPVVRRDDLPASIAYLTRRLDENTSPENFLRALFKLEVGSAEWHEQRERFERAVAAAPHVSTASRRDQDRTRLSAWPQQGRFENAPDTDWTVEANRRWIGGHLAEGPPTSVVPTITAAAEIDAVVERSAAAGTRWAALSFGERRRVLLAAAEVIEAQRGSTLAVMAEEAGKTVIEGDAEVSEAIDFARYYAHCTTDIERRLEPAGAADFTPAGVVVVASPWNFPYAIAAGGVLAALAAGNTAILKPAPEVRGTAWLLANQLWGAGVPSDVLQYVACPDDEVGRRLITHPAVATVVLTGAYDTAMMFLDWKPSLRLLAETSGKNAMVITAAADEDAAIRDLVRSAFGHAGQKCSAASLAIVERALYDDHSFRSRLADAVRSVRVGPAADLKTMMGPLIAAPSETLRRALTTLDHGEEWLVEPRQLDATDRVLRAGARRLARRRPRSRDRAAEHGRVRAHRRNPIARRARGEPVARSGGGGQRLRQSPHHRSNRAAPAVRGLEALVGGVWPEGRRAVVRGGVRCVVGGSRRPGGVRPRVEGALRCRARSLGPAVGAQHPPLPAAT
ncbi:MAG: putA [Acidimicrobiaceae bacterium]|nr:MAG: putA [Acidimicrobiaceae bacterium]